MLLIGDHKVSKVICLRCLRRWNAARGVDVRLDELVCPDCNTAGTVIETGETCVAEELIELGIERAEEHDVRTVPVENGAQ